MIEMIIYGRGGQGGVTLAKLIATAYFLRGKFVQAFGVYAAERSGAPVQAFVRIDDAEITNTNQIHRADHVVVLDRTLIGPKVAAGLKADGWLILNSPDPPEHFQEVFAGRKVATIDATGLAIANELGTRAVPIVNTTMLGAAARALGLGLDDVVATLKEVKFGGANATAAHQAYEQARLAELPGEVTPAAPSAPARRVASILDADVGAAPQIRTGTWATRQPQRRTHTPPCNHACPAGNDVQRFVQQVSQRDYDAALATLLETTPLPGICGRVCPAPCMSECNRRSFDQAVDVRDIERYASEHGQWPGPQNPWRPQRVAVVGSGPAGLSATYHLARLGYAVHLYEADHELGGLLRTGIPTYRLPRDVLDREISHILRHGVTVHAGRRLDPAGLLALSCEYGAVFIATGLQVFQGIDLGPNVPEVVIQGIRFLDRARRGEEFLAGLRVVVIGGGNTAIDAARSARRLGARPVRVLYRRTRDQMPAIEEEIEEALEEGITLEELVAPVRLRRDSTAWLLTCQRMRLGPLDESGRARPVPVETEDAFFDVPCDRVILALGQTPDLAVLPAGEAVLDDRGAISRASGQTSGTSSPRVTNTGPIFVGGDLATNAGTVAAAIGSGRRAARRIHELLSGEPLPAPAEQPLATPEIVKFQAFQHQLREPIEHLDPTLRVRTFAEVRGGLVDEPGHFAAACEAQRCLSCGVCNQCDTCVAFCPEGVLRRDGQEYCFDLDYCKGCGVCASVCPRGVIDMAEL